MALKLYPYHRARAAVLCFAMATMALDAGTASDANAQIFPQQYRPSGEIRWQAAGLGLLYGGFAGFALGSHIDRRINSSGRSPDDAAAALLFAGSLSGTLGGFIWGAQSEVESGRLALSASAVLWGSVLAFGVRGAMGRGGDSRSSLLIGTSMGLAVWHLWDDIELSRGMSWFVDAGGAAGTLLAGLISSNSGPELDFNATSQQRAEREERRFLVFTAVLSAVLAGTTAIAVLIDSPVKYPPPARRFGASTTPTFEMTLSPVLVAGGDRPGLSLVGRF